MSLNFKEIDVCLVEMNLTGYFIQKIRQPDFSSIILDLYRQGEKNRLLICLSQNKTRLHFICEPAQQQLKLQRFSQFLRSHIDGGRITEAVQIGQDRIIRITIQKNDEFILFWIRLWGNSPNIIITNPEGLILDSFFRKPSRGEVSGGTYFPQATVSDSPSRNPDRYSVRELPGEGTFCSKLETYYNGEFQLEEIEALRKIALAKLDNVFIKFSGIVDSLNTRLEKSIHAEEFKIKADILSSSLHLIKKGMNLLETENFYSETCEIIQIDIDSSISPSDNVEKYYKEYKKQKNAEDFIRDELSVSSAKLRRIIGLIDTAKVSQSIDEIKSILAKFRSTPQIKADSFSGKKELPGLIFSSGEFTILAGRNAKENDALLRKAVRGNDLWLHTRDYPGGYIFIKTKPGKSIPLDVLLDAGNLAIHYSKAKNSGQADLYYTQVKYLRRAKDGPLGLVLPTHEKNLFVKVDAGKIARLLEKTEEE